MTNNQSVNHQTVNQTVNQSNSQSVIMKMMIVKDAGGPGHPMELWAGVRQQGLGWTLSVNIMMGTVVVIVMMIRMNRPMKQSWRRWIFGFTCSASFPLSSTRTVSPPEVSQFVGQYLGSWFRVSLVSMCTLSHCLCICLGQFVGQYVGSWFWFSPVTVFSLCAIVSTVQDANSVLHRKS